ncbi:hypothetical protein H0E87_030340, partial [Populus deltoides]
SRAAVRVFWFTAKGKGNEGSGDGPQEAGNLWFGFNERGVRPTSVNREKEACGC